MQSPIQDRGWSLEVSGDPANGTTPSQPTQPNEGTTGLTVNAVLPHVGDGRSEMFRGSSVRWSGWNTPQQLLTVLIWRPTSRAIQTCAVLISTHRYSSVLIRNLHRPADRHLSAIVIDDPKAHHMPHAAARELPATTGHSPNSNWMCRPPRQFAGLRRAE